MITAQNIQDVCFTKKMGGYKTDEVDAFLDQCAATIESLNATIAENTNKMQVLAETIVEYRNQEDNIRTALLSAQRMSDTVIAEANEKAEAIIAEAQVKADAITEESKKSIQNEIDELARIQKEVAAFRSKLLATYREHLTLIGILSEEPEVTAEEDVKTDVEEPTQVVAEEETVTVPVDDVKIDISAFELTDDE